LPKDASAGGDRQAVGWAVRERMAQLGFSTAELARRSGLSETTIRDIMQGTSRNNKSTLVAISAVLSWPPDYLVNILHGDADKNVAPESPLETYLAKLALGLAEIGALREDIAGLKEIVDRIDKKLDVMSEARGSSAHSQGG
jgi:transcriptional regulator with XRE-family HTH domain